MTHDLDIILEIGGDSIFLDADAKTIIARGPPRELLASASHPTVREFLTRGQALAPLPASAAAYRGRPA